MLSDFIVSSLLAVLQLFGATYPHPPLKGHNTTPLQYFPSVDLQRGAPLSGQQRHVVTAQLSQTVHKRSPELQKYIRAQETIVGEFETLKSIWSSCKLSYALNALNDMNDCVGKFEEQENNLNGFVGIVKGGPALKPKALGLPQTTDSEIWLSSNVGKIETGLSEAETKLDEAEEVLNNAVDGMIFVQQYKESIGKFGEKLDDIKIASGEIKEAITGLLKSGAQARTLQQAPASPYDKCCPLIWMCCIWKNNTRV